MSRSVIRFEEYEYQPSNGQTNYKFSVHPSESIRLPFQIQRLKRRSSWYKQIAWKHWTNGLFFKFGEIHCFGRYALDGDDNILSLTQEGVTQFIGYKNRVNGIRDFLIRDNKSGEVKYCINGVANSGYSNPIRYHPN